MSQRTRLYIAAGVVLAVYIVIELIPLPNRPEWLRAVQSFLPALMLVVATWLTFAVRQAAGLPYRKPPMPSDNAREAKPKAEAVAEDTDEAAAKPK